MVTMRRAGNGTITVRERTDGALTLAAYGVLACVRELRLKEKDALRLVEALQGTGGPEQALRSFFEGGEAFLSDLQVVLEWEGIPYALSMRCGNDLGVRSRAA